jgi:Na+/H+ antiporter NhaD/arsenite permease-like protein
MGSSLTPIGNPQNIYLFSAYKLNILDFLRLMLPYSVVTLVFLFISFFFIKNTPLVLKEEEVSAPKASGTVFYSLLFILSVLAVFGIINHFICLLVVILALLIFDRKIIF